MTIAIREIQKYLYLNDLARIVIVDHKGSAPRETGTAMLISESEIFGTIGGGALELDAIDQARNVLETRNSVFLKYPLGPALGQCCGGAVSVVIEPLSNWPERRTCRLSRCQEEMRPQNSDPASRSSWTPASDAPWPPGQSFAHRSDRG